MVDKSEDSSAGLYVTDRARRIVAALSQEELTVFDSHIRNDVAANVSGDIERAILTVTHAAITKLALAEYELMQEYPNDKLLAALIDAYDRSMEQARNRMNKDDTGRG